MSAVTPQQRAIEFGEYLAKGAEHLLDALNAGFLAREAVEEYEGEDDAALKALTDAVDQALQYEAEMMRGLRSNVYEFRKRAERANASLAQSAPTESQTSHFPEAGKKVAQPTARAPVAPTEPAGGKAGPFAWHWKVNGSQGFVYEDPTTQTYTKPYVFTPLYTSPQQSAGAPPKPESAAVPWGHVVAAIRAVGTEAARRGEMFPQTRDEQNEDRAAVRRVAEMVEWYATRGGAVAEQLPDWPKFPLLPAHSAEEPKL